MKKKILLLLLSGAYILPAFAQGNKVLSSDEKESVLSKTQAPLSAASDTVWKTGGNVSLNIAQTSLTNWASGGQNSINGLGIVNLYGYYRKGNNQWDNDLFMTYGMQKTGSNPFVKSDDKIQLNSRYGYNISKNWLVSGLVNFSSQFQPGYEIENNVENKDKQTSAFMSPGYFLFSLGLTYKPNDNFSITLSPATVKLTVVRLDSLAPAYGLDPGKNVRTELGAYARVFWHKELIKNVTYQTTLDLFSNYASNPQNVDVNWNNLLTLKVNKFISASLIWSLVYDDNVTLARTPAKIDPVTGNNINLGPALQFKEVLGIGFAYKFGYQPK